MQGLLIVKNSQNDILDGGEYINKRNKELLESCCTELDTVKINVKKHKNNFEKLKDMLKHRNFFGLSLLDKNIILDKLNKKKYDFCFISSSLIGVLVKDIKKTYPDIRIIVFFHNLEYIYYKQLTKQTNMYKWILVILARYNENLSIKWADSIVALNNRDANNILNEYNRKVDFIIPTTFKDKYIYQIISNKYIDKKRNLLFVGSDFYANFQGIDWFIRNVLPYLDNIILNIVGKNTEKWKKMFKETEKLKIIGSVESLEKYYIDADVVISPIFLGSGMKTKTAEAMMYGKYIFGTSEAFEGYDIDFKKIGGLCNNKEDFIRGINRHFKLINTKYNEYSRAVFLEKYCTDKWIPLLAKFLKME